MRWVTQIGLLILFLAGIFSAAGLAASWDASKHPRDSKGRFVPARTEHGTRTNPSTENPPSATKKKAKQEGGTRLEHCYTASRTRD